MIAPLAALACASLYSQCGGQNWSGSTCCESGSSCQVINEYYSQCTAGSNVPQPPPVPITSIAPPIKTSAPSAPNPSFNPFVGAVGYINPEYTASVDGSIKLDPSIKETATIVKNQPSAIWIDTIANLHRVKDAMPIAAKQASAEKPVTVTFVVYDLPGRDCAALASAGEIAAGDLKRYKNDYIDVFASYLQEYADPNVRVILIIEPGIIFCPNCRFIA